MIAKLNFLKAKKRETFLAELFIEQFLLDSTTWASPITLQSELPKKYINNNNMVINKLLWVISQ